MHVITTLVFWSMVHFRQNYKLMNSHPTVSGAKFIGQHL